MKQYLNYILFIIGIQFVTAQVQDGTLTINGTVDFSQVTATMEAGLNDTESFNSAVQPELSFILNPTTSPLFGVTSSEQNCETVYLYKVFIHTTGAPTGAIVKAKTFDNSGQRFPLVSVYDTLLPVAQYFGPRDLTAETNGADADGFITIPNDATQAIKVFEFKGCRQDIPIEFKVSPDVFTPSGTSSFNVVYTITAEPFS
ncbi:hypothetical protein OE09_0368 [Flavobacteriaceae bacterium MAR_2010_72]|nr:hypothetical protein OE09_0368 [Flavobacteriaceae bacterium MAR_2010_72]TVZ57922.1 hypothetical protein NA63_0413 [Flavobacteriaceae bacterium MAR_2010_105]